MSGGDEIGGSSIVIPLPPEVVQYKDDIRRFIHAMVYKLSVHHKKGKWEGMSVDTVISLLGGEVDELKEAADRGNVIEVVLEAADVANYAMIAASIITEGDDNE